jgi:hypothetical protein
MITSNPPITGVLDFPFLDSILASSVFGAFIILNLYRIFIRNGAHIKATTADITAKLRICAKSAVPVKILTIYRVQ